MLFSKKDSILTLKTLLYPLLEISKKKKKVMRDNPAMPGNKKGHTTFYLKVFYYTKKHVAMRGTPPFGRG